MKAIFGLGNPGKQYAETRHNVGFMVVELLARRHGLPGKHWSKFQAMGAEGNIAGERVLLLQPLTFMNNSGQTVQAVSAFYKLERSDILVVYDDFALPLGAIRMRVSGSAGGHNGVSSIIRLMGSNEFPRLRLGIGPVIGFSDTADFVLARFEKKEEAERDIMIERAADAVEMWLKKGAEETMNLFNAKAEVKE
ncbi:MAG TPA: aminoacyl-tRNA hydrolase [Chroococcales cyanobacterium]|jgi:PTH1 family peptidyl-tRNA hydrolase